MSTTKCSNSNFAFFTTSLWARRRPPRKAGSSYHHGDLRHAMLAAAGALIEEEGVDGLSLRECARRAGVSHGAPAHHFGDVRGQLTALAAQSFEILVTYMDRYEARRRRMPSRSSSPTGRRTWPLPWRIPGGSG